VETDVCASAALLEQCHRVLETKWKAGMVLYASDLLRVLLPFVDLISDDRADAFAPCDARAEVLLRLREHGVGLDMDAAGEARTGQLLAWAWVLDTLLRQEAENDTLPTSADQRERATPAAYAVAVCVCQLFARDVLALWAALAYTIPQHVVAQCVRTLLCTEKMLFPCGGDNTTAPWLMQTMQATGVELGVLHAATMTLEVLWHYRDRAAFHAMCDMHAVLYAIMAARRRDVPFTLVDHVLAPVVASGRGRGRQKGVRLRGGVGGAGSEVFGDGVVATSAPLDMPGPLAATALAANGVATLTGHAWALLKEVVRAGLPPLTRARHIDAAHLGMQVVTAHSMFPVGVKPSSYDADVEDDGVTRGR
jgi:hypothetical protein